MLYKANPSVIQLYIADSSQNSKILNAGSLAPDVWLHVVGLYDGSNLSIYIDGALKSTDATTITSLYSSDQNVEVGTYSDQATGYLNQIALPRIYNRALTATEVSRNYNADRSKFGL